MDAGLNQTRMTMLGEFAELTLALARDLQQSALVAEDADEKARLAEAFHRLGRGLRQSLALHARLERDAERAAREAQADLRSQEQARRARHKASVNGVLEQLIWTEAEKPDSALDSDVALHDLELLLDAEADRDEFLDQDPDALIAKLAQTLGLPAPNPSNRHGQAGPGQPETPTFQDSLNGAAAITSAASAHLGSRDEPGNDGGEGERRSSA